jgi:catalase
MLYILAQVDSGLAAGVAFALRLHIPKEIEGPLNQSIPADGDPAMFQPVIKEGSLKMSAALSMANTIKDNIRTRRVAVLTADGVDGTSLNTVKKALLSEGAEVDVIAPRQNYVISESDEQIAVDQSFATTASVLYDAVYVPGGTNSVATLEADPDAIHFLNQAFKHCKAIAADAQALQVLQATYFFKKLPEDYSNETVIMEGIIISADADKLAKQFINAIAQHRFWEREKPRKVPA